MYYIVSRFKAILGLFLGQIRDGLYRSLFPPLLCLKMAVLKETD